MGIYWYAVDEENKKQIRPPDEFNNKSPGVFHPKNPFPNMITMMNVYGSNFIITNDFKDFHDERIYEDITDEVYEKFKKEFKDFDWKLYEKKEVTRCLE